MRPTALLVLLGALAACLPSRPENRRAKERIFSAHPQEAPPPAQVPIDLGTLASDTAVQDHALSMGEREAADRLGSFRLRGKLTLSFEASGRKLALVEDRLVEQGATGDLHLRLLEDTGGGVELLLAGGKLAGRSRYGPFVEREVTDELDRQRDEIWGALASLYLESNRGWKLSPMNLETVAGRSCQRFDVGRGTERPRERPERFGGRLDEDSQKHFEFLYGRSLDGVSGSICLDRETGVPLSAKVTVLWSARGDAGTARVEAALSQTVADVGKPVKVAWPASVLPRAHRPRGQAAALERYGFLQLTDGGTLGPATPGQAAPPHAPKN